MTDISHKEYNLGGPYRTLARLHPKSHSDHKDTTILVKQHEGTLEIIVEIYGCRGGLRADWINGGTYNAIRPAKWFRSLTTMVGWKVPCKVVFYTQAHGVSDDIRFSS